ncbi:MAG: restriction endonuclease [Thaumarchaeota archaeon]|nr:restriction endonuclease [Nitrososphaerota archaeon]
MRQITNGKMTDLSHHGIEASPGFVGVGWWGDKDGDPNAKSEQELRQMDKHWKAKSQIYHFIKDIRRGDIMLLATKHSGILALGVIDSEKPYVDNTPPYPRLILRWKVKWLETKYQRDNLLGLGDWGQSTLARKEELDEFIEDLKQGRKINPSVISYDPRFEEDALKQIETRLGILPPSYFEDLVRFLAEKMGMQFEIIYRIGTSDGGWDGIGWRVSQFFAKDPKRNIQRFCIQVKRRKVQKSDIEDVREKLLEDQIGILVSSVAAELLEEEPDLFKDGRVILVDGQTIARYVLKFHSSLPPHLTGILRISQK